jgi:polysaccharide deacetylase family protein (PEP-CTERM system associated)
MDKAITFTLDLEDHRPDESLPVRYPEMTEKILEFLDERNIKATVFTVGSLAKKDPDIVRKVHAAGHEIAHHSYDHITLNRQNSQEFREDTRRAKEVIEDIIGEEVRGYRAPVFSLTRQTIWAVDILKELGFTYSSSVLPAANPLHGIPGAPQAAFRWANGLLEFPVPVGRLGPFLMPYLGGVYFRYLPFSIVRRQIKKADDGNALWTYWHPYDFDAEEKNWRIKNASTPASLLLWMNRKNTFKKLGMLAENFKFDVPLRDRNFGTDLKIVDPATL